MELKNVYKTMNKKEMEQVSGGYKGQWLTALADAFRAATYAVL